MNSIQSTQPFNYDEVTSVREPSWDAAHWKYLVCFTQKSDPALSFAQFESQYEANMFYEKCCAALAKKQVSASAVK